MWIPTEHEKYGVGKFNACIIIVFIIFIFAKKKNICVSGHVWGFLELIYDGLSRAFFTEVSQSWRRRAER